jgi:hypothetical protein
MISNSLSLTPSNGMLPDQMTQLRRHITHCRAARGAWFPAALAGETLHQLIAPRFVTTLAVVCLVLALTCG